MEMASFGNCIKTVRRHDALIVSSRWWPRAQSDSAKELLQQEFLRVKTKSLRKSIVDAFRYRLFLPMSEKSSRGMGFIKHRVYRRLVPFDLAGTRQLHIGCGREALPGWTNVDVQAYLEADVVQDVTHGLPYSELQRIFSEHFLEHLDFESALAFLAESNRLLAEDGWLRLTTPNLDWVWANVYSPDPDQPNRLTRGFHANRSFYGWQHRFLWNRELLHEAAVAAGFSEIRWCQWGLSNLPEFRGIERHERYPDSPGLPHILILEAQRGNFDSKRYQEFVATAHQEFLGSLKG